MNLIKPHMKRAARDDGENTRARLLEAAGQIFAERGYACATSKAICERAQTNLAAVNYHFGSRDSLLMAVLEAAHNHLINLDSLVRLAESPLDPREKLESLIDGLLHLRNQKNWQIRLWARELIFPSPLFSEFLSQHVRQKVGILHQFISDYTGLPADSPTLHCCLVSVMASCLAMVVVDGKMNASIMPVRDLPTEEAARHIKTFIFGGLASCAAQNAAAGA